MNCRLPLVVVGAWVWLVSFQAAAIAEFREGKPQSVAKARVQNGVALKSGDLDQSRDPRGRDYLSLPHKLRSIDQHGIAAADPNPAARKIMIIDLQ